MASTGLNFANLTPDNGAIKDLKRLIFLAVTDPESLGKIFNFLPKQKHGEKVGFVGEFGMVGKASQGCNPTFGTSILATTEKEWDIREWEVAEKICYKDLEGTVAQVAMRIDMQDADAGIPPGHRPDQPERHAVVSAHDPHFFPRIEPSFRLAVNIVVQLRRRFVDAPQAALHQFGLGTAAALQVRHHAQRLLPQPRAARQGAPDCRA